MDDRGARCGRPGSGGPGIRRRAISGSASSSTCCGTAAKRGCARFHVACADEGGNVELFMQSGFVRYGEEMILHRPGGQGWPTRAPGGGRASAHPAERALRCAPAEPAPCRRHAPAGRPAGGLPTRGLGAGRQPRAHPALIADTHPATRRHRGIRAGCASRRTAPELAAFLQIGVAKEEQPHYLRVICRADHDPTPLIRYGLSVIGERSGEVSRGGGGGDDDPRTRGVLAAVRTYESPLDRRLEEAGFRQVAQVSLLLKETLVRVAEPALLPATTR